MPDARPDNDPQHGNSGAAVREARPHGPGESPGDVIGRYKLLEVIGVGGFGVVWLAEQEQPVRRRVALKVIKPGMDSRAVIARFEAERQALALMSHPGIAKVLDAGTTPMAGPGGGRPYFVMEHVKGEPITDYCDRQRLTVEQRLRLFAQVCEAVQHAHMRGIIHRDLKPGNILVAIAESGQARPVVIDFGVAKALAGRLTDSTIYTEQGMLIGTPEYMSPEQAEMSETDIDTRTDVYALGVVLYELLTGALPFDPRSLRAAGQAAIQKIIREQDPPRPSTRLSTLGPERQDVAEARRVRFEELARTLRRELEWIPLKALRKDRAERYRSAAELADDVANYLGQRPLLAGPESPAYLVRKFVRRNKTAVGAAAVVALSLVVATGVSAWFAVTAKKALAREATALVREREQKEEALAESRRATAFKDFLLDTLRASDPSQEGRESMMVSEAILRGVDKIGEGSLAESPRLRAEVLAASAEIVRSNGKAAEALPLAERALATTRDAKSGDSPELAQALTTLGKVKQDLGKADEAQPLYTQALEMHQRLKAGDSLPVAESLANVGSAMQALGKQADAELVLVKSLEMKQRLLKGDNAAIAQGMSDLAYVQADLGKLSEAEKLFSQALDMCRRLMKGDQPMIATAINNLAVIRDQLGHAAEAEPLYNEALEMQRRIHKGDHNAVAEALNNVAFVKKSLGKQAEAEPLFVETLEMRRRMFKGDHPDIALTLINLAATRSELGRPAEAEPLLVEALEMRRRLFKGDHPSIASALGNLGMVKQALGKDAQAEPLYEEALGIYQRLFKGDHQSVAWSLNNVATIKRKLGHEDQAELLYAQSLAMLQRMFKGDHPNVAATMNNLGASRQRLGRAADAEPLLSEALAMRQRLYKGDHPDVAVSLVALASVKLDLGKNAEALTLAEQADAMARRVLPPESPNLAKYSEMLTKCRAANQK
jgi:eukaryotic-like serine/threonine-protein kinase